MWLWKRLMGGLPPDKGGSSSDSGPPDGIKQISESVYSLHEPPGPPEIEIVFIHGLQLSDYEKAYWKTWIVKENDKDGREVCWPMAWLGEEFPKARILSLKYDLSVMRTNTSGRMDWLLLGESLLQEMVEMANIGQRKNCPVLFVCHCIGGLVVKDIIIQAHRKFGNEVMYLNLLQNIRGFHFYATPHLGSKLADLGVLLPHMREVVSLVRVINKELGRVNTEFERIGRDYYSGKWRYSVVAETHITRYHGFSGMVVEEASARHGYAKFLPVDADHFGVCKPSHKASSSYLSLKNFIALVVAAEKIKRKDNLLELPNIVVGMDSRVKEVCGKLEGHCMVGLFGMGGVGKTTLSKCVFNEQIEKDNFERYCFLEDVQSCGSIEGCQRELFRKLCGERWDENKDMNFHLRKIRNCIMSKKVLLVADDVGDEVNMRALQVPAFNDGKRESKVIVTTRRYDTLLNVVEEKGIIEVNFLSGDQAFELFSYYAFTGIEEIVRAQFYALAEEIAKACGVLPLSLEVIGQFLRSKWTENRCESIERQMEFWDKTLWRLKDAKPFDPFDRSSSVDRKLWAMLKISFDDLENAEKSIFLDMACIMCNRYEQMMEGNDSGMLCRSTLEQVWNSPLGIDNLTHRSLIKWSGKKETLVIHHQLQDMARVIVMSEADGNRSWMWDSDAGLQFMLQRKGSRTLEGLFLGGVDESVPEFGRLKKTTVGSLNATECFDNLRLLNLPCCGEEVVQYYTQLSTEKLIWAVLNGSHVTERSIRGLNHFKGLRALYMRRCEYLTTLPTCIGNLSYLMELDLSLCGALKCLPENFGKLQELQVLKLSGCDSLEVLPTSIGNLSLLNELDLSLCGALKYLPDSIGGLQRLYSLQLYGCGSLEALPTSINNLFLLNVLDLSWCGALKCLPDSMGGLQRLHSLLLNGCGSLEVLPTSIGNLSLLSELDLSLCGALKCLPDSIGGLQRLQILKLNGCGSLEALPTSIGNLSLLNELDLSLCGALKCLPEGIGRLQKLQILKLNGCGSLEALPTSIGNLSLLDKLDLSLCGALKYLPDSIGGLQRLYSLQLYGCGSLEALPTSINNLFLLNVLDLSWCGALKCLPDSIGGLQRLQILKLNGCGSLEALPTSIGNLSLLNELDLSLCGALKYLPDSFGGLQELKVLKINECDSLEALPTSIGNLSLLNELELSWCGALKCLPEEICGLQKLQILKLNGCGSLEALPTSIGNLSLLNELDLSLCGALKCLPKEIGGLQKLQILKLSGCGSLEVLPTSIGNLSLLNELDLSWCKALKYIPESINELRMLQILNLDECVSLEANQTSTGDYDFEQKNDISMFELMHEEIMTNENIFEASLKDLDGEETIVLCSYNTIDDFFEFYFKHCEDMASVVGVGLEYAKVILIKGWEVKVEEALEEDWVQAWKKVESSSTTMSKLLRVESNGLNQGEKRVFTEGNFPKPLLWDLAKYFTLKETMDFLAKCATKASGASSNSQGSSNNDNKGSIFQEGFSKWYFENRLKKGRAGKDNEDNNDGEENEKGKAAADHGPSDAVDASTKVIVELLPGGEISEMFGRAFDEKNHTPTTNQKLKTLDKTIFSNLEFTFVNRDGVKKIEVIVGNICFNLGFNADHGTSEQVKWIHSGMKVSFGLLGDDVQRFGELERDSFKPLDVKTGTQNSTASKTIEEKKGKEYGGQFGLYGTPLGVGLRGHVEGKIISGVNDIQQLQTSFETSCDLSKSGLIIERQMDPDERQIVCDCFFPQSNTYDPSKSPMSFNQIVRFQGTWIPLDVGEHGVPLDLVRYTLIASRSLEENVWGSNAKALKAANIKTRMTGKRKTTQHEPHVTCKQRFYKTLHINHAMTHLDGKRHRLRERERLHDKSRYFSGEGSQSPYKWKNGALVKLQEEVSSTEGASSVATTSSSGWSFLDV